MQLKLLEFLKIFCFYFCYILISFIIYFTTKKISFVSLNIYSFLELLKPHVIIFIFLLAFIDSILSHLRSIQGIRAFRISSILILFFLSTSLTVWNTIWDFKYVIYVLGNLGILGSDLRFYLTSIPILSYLSLLYLFLIPKFKLTKQKVETSPFFQKLLQETLYFLIICFLPLLVIYICFFLNEAMESSLGPSITSSNSSLEKIPDQFPKKNLVIFLLESVRQDSLELQNTKFWSDTSKTISIPKFYIPVPHTGNSIYSLMTGLHSKNATRPNFQRINPEISLSYKFQAKGYSTFFISTAPSEVEQIDQMLLHFKIPLIDKKQIQKQFPKYSQFSWGVDDESLIDVIKNLLPSIQSPFLIILQFSNSHSPYFTPGKEVQDPKKRYLEAVRKSVEITEKIIAFTKMSKPDDTIFILLSDHGESFGEYGFWRHDFSLFNPELNVPFYIHSNHLKLRKNIYPRGHLLDLNSTIRNMFHLEKIDDKKNIFHSNYEFELPVNSWGGQNIGILQKDEKYIFLEAENRLVVSDLEETNISEVREKRNEWIEKIQEKIRKY